ncbi:MAG: hypothetical protein ACE5KM_24970 [Planctomycetaceae bacterium]
MNADHAPNRWSDEDVESLLTEFYRHEMPRHLAAPSRRAQPAQRATASPAPRSHRYTGLGVVACALLLAMTALSPTGRRFLAPGGDAKTVVEKPVADGTPVQPEANIAEDRHPAKSPLLQILPPEMRGEFNPDGSPVVPEDNIDNGADWLEILGVRLHQLPKKNETPRRLDGPVPFTPQEP